MTPSSAESSPSDSSLDPVKTRLETRFQQSVDEMIAAMDPALTIEPIGRLLKNHLTLPGKRLRSLLFLLTLQTLDPDRPLDQESFRIAVGIEFFHEFLLIHDDVIDSSSTRRGGPTLWRRLETEQDLPTVRARSVATILGDLLYAQAIDCVATANVPPAIRVDLIHTLMAAAGQTGWGAAAEIIMAEAPICEATETSLQALYHAKTTHYTFGAPMIMAAIMAGGSGEMRATLTAIGPPLGLAFQLENDLHELTQLKQCALPVPVDLKDHVKTLPMVRLHGMLPPQDRDRLNACLSGALDESARASVVELMEQTGLIGTMQEAIEDAFDQPFSILDRANLDPVCRARLHNIIRFIQANRNHSEA